MRSAPGYCMLLISPDVEYLKACTIALTRRSFDVVSIRDTVAALDALEQRHFDLAVVDLDIASNDIGETFIHVHREWPTLPIIVLTRRGSVRQSLQMIHDGAFDYLSRPVDIDYLAQVCRNAVEESFRSYLNSTAHRIRGRAGRQRSARNRWGDHDFLAAKPPSDKTATRRVGEFDVKPIDADSMEEQNVVRVLLIDCDGESLRSLSEALCKRNVSAVTALSVAKAYARLSREVFDVVVLEPILPDGDGLKLLHDIRHVSPRTEVVLLTSYPNVSTAIHGMRMGAFDYFVKPQNEESLVRTIITAYWKKRTCEERELSEPYENGRQP